MKFLILQGDRKSVRDRLEEMTGEKARYTMAPRFAYILRGIAMERNGEVTADTGADLSLCRKLEEEGVIQALEPYPMEEETVVALTRNFEPLAEASEQDESETATESPGLDENTEPYGLVECEAEDAPIGPDEAAESRVESVVTECMIESPELPEEPVNNNEALDASYSDMVERIELTRPAISFPLSRHRAASICNLVYTIFSRGRLLSKATGGTFRASQSLVETLKAESFIRVDDVLTAIEEIGSDELQGIRFEDGKVIFDGFPETSSKEEIKAWMELSAAINKTAIKQNNIHAKELEEVNEKFAFRTWLTRLGMNGADLKSERLLLYRNLSGHTAFRTPDDEQKWKARQAAKREELRAQKEEGEAE